VTKNEEPRLSSKEKIRGVAANEVGMSNLPF
jgi:hypothetical protein